jgi:hypothetical protein
MASLEQTLASLFNANAPLVALIGTRSYPLRLPPTVTLPAVHWQLISRTGVHAQGTQRGVPRSRVQFTCTAQSYGGAKAVADALLTALDGYKGTVAGTKIGAALVENERDDYDEEANVWRRLLDFFITVEV